MTYLKESLGAPPPDDVNRQGQINLIRNSLPTDISTLGEDYCKLRDEIDALEIQVSAKKLKLDAHIQSLVSWLEGAGLSKFKLDSGNSIAISDKPYCQVVDKEAWMAWIHETNQEALLSVHYQTMNGLVASYLTDGKPIPPGVKAYIKSSITRYKPR